MCDAKLIEKVKWTFFFTFYNASDHSRKKNNEVIKLMWVATLEKNNGIKIFPTKAQLLKTFRLKLNALN